MIPVRPDLPQEQTLPADLNEEAIAQLLLSSDVAALKAAADTLLGKGRNREAVPLVKRVIELNDRDTRAKFIYALLLDDGTIAKLAECRERLLSILDEFPEIFEQHTDENLSVIREAARRCSYVGPMEKAIELFRHLAPNSNRAIDYFHLSEILTQGNFLEESLAALRKAIELDPKEFDTEANRETLRIAAIGKAQAESAPKTSRKKIGRYPVTEDFRGDLQALIKDHIAVNLRKEGKFISRQTRFFTMGSCFARNISRSLNMSGYFSNHMEISEHINTTFANRAFVDWLSGGSKSESISERIVELLPPGSSAENILQVMRHSDVFILTLGVAPAFFDRQSGEFVLPRPTALNSRVLAEKYEFRTTTVRENVDNVLYLINFIRNVSPSIKVVITVSPVPLMASFEFESCVQADCLSKSTMRLAAHEVVNNSGLKDILYWPSFEVFRWAGSNASDYYAADDGAAWHVSEKKVDDTINAFIDIFGS